MRKKIGCISGSEESKFRRFRIHSYTSEWTDPHRSVRSLYTHQNIDGVKKDERVTFHMLKGIQKDELDKKDLWVPAYKVFKFVLTKYTFSG
ncbi:MAG: hypothetical protein PUF16_08285 [Lachnospiraceae bacterium]|nr:hypothetical protein [Lachnospiraceae bacterium]